MFRSGVHTLRLFAASLLLTSFSAAATSQAVRSRVTAPVSNAQLATLHGGMNPLARPEFDKGEIDDATPANRMMLVLQRSPEQEAALRSLLDQQQSPSSPKFHQWETPASFGLAFGPSDGDLAALTAWISGSGFTGIKVNAARTVVEFSGTAGTLKSAFHTSLHHFLVNGVTYTANANDPQLPAALAPIVAGFSSLNNFPRAAQNIKAGEFRRDKATGKLVKLDAAGNPLAGGGIRGSKTSIDPDFTFRDGIYTDYGITPYDFATIYNVTPLWNATTPIDGTGQTIAIAGRTDINPIDFVNFRKIFGLPSGANNSATGSSYLNIIYNGPNPGINADEGEADVDTQWSSAVAKGATIDFVTSADTIVSAGTDLSSQYIADNNLAPVMSLSYGECELGLGVSGNLFYLQLWEQASAQGITAMVSSGDSGNAACDQDSGAPAEFGASVSGYASTPYNVAVGGTDFNILTGGSKYFSSTNNATTEASALSYIPEVPWNNTCANPILDAASGFPWTGDTPEQTCNNSSAIADGLDATGGGGGGASSCINGNGQTFSSCSQGYAKPSWQTGKGVLADGVRDVPDVSLFASNGFFGAFYIICQQDTSANGTCDVNSPYEDFEGLGGTSVSSPAFAGMMALVNQQTGARQGNANYVLYKLFNAQVTAGTSCATAAGSVPASNCIFNDITTGSIQQPCYKGDANCSTTTASDAYGVVPGGIATAGYDTATGLGSVNAANMVTNWNSAALTATTTTLTLTPTTIVHGSAVTAAAKVTAASGTPSGDVSFNGATVNGSVPFGTLSAGAYSAPISSFPGGTYSVVAHYAGSSIYAESNSTPVTLTVTPEASTVTVSPQYVNYAAGGITITSSSAPYGQPDYVSFQVAGASGQGIATGTLTVKDNGAAFDGGIISLNSSGGYADYSPSLGVGTHSLIASYGGDASFKASLSAAAAFTVTKAPTTDTTSGSASTVSANGTVTFYATINTTSYGYYAPSGIVTFMLGSKTLGTGTLYQTYDPNTYFNESLTDLVIPANQLATGANAITVVYAGDSNYGAPSNGTINVNVTAPTLTASVAVASVSPTTFNNGGTITIGATVTPSSPAPTGTAEFFIDGNDYGAITITAGSGTISGTLGGLATGTHSVFVVYSGDTHYQASTSAAVTFTVPVGATASSTAIALSASTITPGAAVSAIATVTPSAATGTVQVILDGNTYGGTPALSAGTVTVALPTTLTVGMHTVAFVYSGNSTYVSSTSPTVHLVVSTSTPTTTTVTLNPSTITAGGSSVATVTVSPAAATGTLQLAIDGINSGSSLNFTGGSTTVTLPTTIGAGTHVISFIYAGSNTYATSFGSANLIVNGAATTTTVTLNPTTVSQGISSTATVTVSPAAATGTLQLAIDGVNSGSAITFAGGTTTVTVPSTSLGVGPHTVLITYSGNTSYNTSSNTATLTVTAAIIPSFSLTPTAPATATVSAPGQTSTGITLTTTPVNGYTGTISFACTSGLPSGVACVFTPSTVAVTGTAAPTTVLTFTTTAPSSGDGVAPHAMLMLGGGSAVLACFGLLFIPRRRRPRFAAWLGLAILLIGAATLSGCGGSTSAAGATHVPSGGTPVNTTGSAITVTATSTTGTALTSQATVTLIVN